MIIQNISTANYHTIKTNKDSNKVDLGFKAKKAVSKTFSYQSISAKKFNNLAERLIENQLEKSELSLLKKELQTIRSFSQKLEEIKLRLGRLIDYEKLKKAGFTKEQLRTFVSEDEIILQNARQFSQEKLNRQEYMFGYPANMTQDSAMTRFLRVKETELPLMNNCGDPYETGNYDMDCKSYEKSLLEKLYKHFGIESSEKPWGYITTGGSESNRWGIYNAIAKYPNGRVYYADTAHYSIAKSLRINSHADNKNITLVKNSKIPLRKDSEKINIPALIKQIEQNWKSKNEPAILILTFGTTKTGAIDDFKTISGILKEKNIPHYIHLDAALYGGIGKNQRFSPLNNYAEISQVDSIAVSLHKYFGNHDVKSVVIAKNPPTPNMIDYIGQNDTTTAGSRTFNPFSALQRVIETLERSPQNEYYKNIRFFENLLQKNKISYTKEKGSNIFVIKRPNNSICQKYQLSDFEENGKKKSHIIIFPHHKKQIMKNLAEELKK